MFQLLYNIHIPHLYNVLEMMNKQDDIEDKLDKSLLYLYKMYEFY